MKVTTLPKILDAIVKNQFQITVPADIAARASLAIERMVSIGGATSSTPPGPGVDPGE
jgi:quinolinate synthase